MFVAICLLSVLLDGLLGFCLLGGFARFCVVWFVCLIVVSLLLNSGLGFRWLNLGY